MGGDMTKAARKPRADSIRNRERLLDAARQVFATGGDEASLEAVARTAGVGIGTLYRHFPTREALFQAVYVREVDELVDLAEELGQGDDPVQALRAWLAGCTRMVATKRGMLAALKPVFDGNKPEVFSNSSARMLQAVGALMQKGVAAGRIRDDISPEEALQAMLGICYAQPPQPGWQASVTLLLNVFVDGLERGANAP